MQVIPKNKIHCLYSNIQYVTKLLSENSIFKTD